MRRREVVRIDLPFLWVQVGAPADFEGGWDGVGARTGISTYCYPGLIPSQFSLSPRTPVLRTPHMGERYLLEFIGILYSVSPSLV